MDLLEYNASFIWNLVPFGSIMFPLPEPSIKFSVLDRVFTLTFVSVKSRKYLLSHIIMCVVAQSTRHTSLSFILRVVAHGFKIKLIKTIDNINSNIIYVIKK